MDDEKQWRQGLKTGDSVVMRLTFDRLVEGRVSKANRYKLECDSIDNRMRQLFSRSTGREFGAPVSAHGWRLVRWTHELAKLATHCANRPVLKEQAESASTRSTKANSSIYKIRVVFHGGTIHLVSSTEPKMKTSEAWDDCGLGERLSAPPEFDWTPVEGSGDMIGYIDWTTVCAVSWRKGGISAPRDRRKTTKPTPKIIGGVTDDDF